MAPARRVRDPLLALEFVSLTFACGSRPPAEQTATAGEGEGESTTTTTTTPTDEADTNVDEWNSSWGLDYGDYDLYYTCDPLQQDCPAQEKCVPVSNADGEFNRAVCVPVSGDIPAGEPCTMLDPSSGFDDCDMSSMCWFVEGETGICVPLCSGAGDDLMCPDGRSCFHWYEEQALWLCVDSCDPLTQDCPAEQACQWAQDGFGCIPSNDVPAAEPCGSIYDCAPASVCLAAEVLDACAAESCCAAYCGTDNPEACAAHPGTACTSFWGEDGPPTPELANVGVCVTP
jgi:hypothetical protein